MSIRVREAEEEERSHEKLEMRGGGGDGVMIMMEFIAHHFDLIELMILNGWTQTYSALWRWFQLKSSSAATVAATGK